MRRLFMDWPFILPTGWLNVLKKMRKGAAFRKTLFTYTSIDAESAASLAAATFDPSVTLPKNLKPHVNVGATSCVLTVTADGTIVIFR